MGKSTATSRGEAPSPSTTRRRNSIRLQGFDYSQPGEYFVTVCTMDRGHIFGDVKEGSMQFSAMGKIVDECWRKIPEHFANTKVDTFQIMPNHIHGIIQIKEQHQLGVIQIKENPRRGEVPSPSITKGDETSPLRKATLGNVIAYFKYQATKHISKMCSTPGRILFQRNYYDHIIRDDVDQYFIEQYIALNPIIWELRAGKMSIEAFRKILREMHALDDYAIERVIEFADTYRVIKA